MLVVLELRILYIKTLSERLLSFFPGKNASFLRVVRTRSMAEEYEQGTANVSELGK